MARFERDLGKFEMLFSTLFLQETKVQVILRELVGGKGVCTFIRLLKINGLHCRSYRSGLI